VGVHDPADLGKLAVKQRMRIQIRRWVQLAFHDLAVQVGNHQIRRRHGCIIHAARLDRHQGLRAGAVDAAGVAKSVRSQPAAGDFTVGVQNLFA
jgi:hypothetical protein